MLAILVILLGIGVVSLAIVIILLWKRMLNISVSSEKADVKKTPAPDKDVPPDDAKTGEISKSSVSQKIPAKAKFPKPKIAQDTGIDQLTKIYSDMPGILGAIFADRFGQTMAADTNLVLDKVAIPAYFLEILEMAHNDKFPTGKPSKMFICGEGSYWVFGDIAGMPWGVWFEHEIEIGTGSAIADDFRENIIKILKANYTRIW